MNSTEPVALTSAEGVTTITLNRPERKNAIDESMWRTLSDMLRHVRDDADTRAVVLQGAGGDFCAGADVAKSAHEEHPLPRLRRIGDVALALFELPVPVIAKVDGVAAGAGCNMALACDLVVASSRARFTEIFTRRGLSIDFGGSWLLPRIVGLQQAKRLALLAEVIDAAEAHRLGMVTWVQPEDQLDDFVAGVAQKLAALPPIALGQTKALLNEGVGLDLPAAIRNEAAAQAVNFATEDAPAAFRSFLDKTDPPHYTGRWAVRQGATRP
ncbi:enoyl-CoA hydratase/isomerase family protein [Geodermatophilus sabuli]|uniref:2-(1,2-epoxy-1,2-dihydrophenyl)acetyl-CoA isomerase n=1 Tax=Geodermatophilus sabuli TaxID=1564158 RepID=A0A285EAC6_9ACTN|nr:enoyl-CoA hydratase-related protein [Geodermatophilus sabuli]MBB3085546.1 2-(1,2-epoxy-1,2-dihydrophenyl)acetyl-CoA isomerase [Geodermatophilus sabuli]SNX96032.1 2-(1,2-epoxy-1,2-dihydrophenyl)acetyl-CoA isomerase [Geodermatophilus sabuli]